MIIKIIYPKRYRDLSIAELKKECMRVFEQKLNGKSVLNKATGARIILSKSGAKHALFARAGGFEKIVALTLIDEIIKTALLDSVNKTTKQGDLFMMKLKAKVKIDSSTYDVTVFVRGTNRGKLYYDHALVK